jgi:glycosyltransferase involved in cell wall biosynthesis
MIKQPDAQNSMPLITFIIPCFNYGRYLNDCLDSILRQEGAWDMEVLAIDDASTDGTQGILRSYTDPRLRIIAHTANQGHVRTITEGFGAARGLLVSRIDPDDRLRPDYLKRVMPIFEKYPEVGLVYGNAALIDQAGHVTAETTDVRHGGVDFKGNEFVPLLASNFICVPTTMARREAWLQALPIPEGLVINEDWHLTTMIARRYEFYFLQATLAEYRVHGVNMHSQTTMNHNEEASFFALLDRYFLETEADEKVENAKRAARSTTYATRYLEFARKYFGRRDARNARRCYLSALRHEPLWLRRMSSDNWAPRCSAWITMTPSRNS